jgi:hypothetical protein
MPILTFVNLPVKDLNKSIGFFSKLGFNFNQQFTDEKATCMIISDESCVMLVTEPFYRTFTVKKIADSTKTTEVLVSLGLDSKASVDNMASKAILAGGAEPQKAHDQGWMYERSFEDLDGHLWSAFWMDPGKIEKQ